MKWVLVHTSVWSLALSKKERTEEEQKIVSYLSKLIGNLAVVLIGPIRQEILSGVSNLDNDFQHYKKHTKIKLEKYT